MGAGQVRLRIALRTRNVSANAVPFPTVADPVMNNVTSAAWASDWPAGYPDQAKVDAVYARLNDQGRAAFVAELKGAAADDIAGVIEAWHLSMLFAFHPHREQVVANAQSGEAVTFEKFMAEMREIWGARDAG